MRRFLCVFALAPLLLLTVPTQAKAQRPPCESGCGDELSYSNSTYSYGTLAPESGPYTYGFTAYNWTSGEIGIVHAACNAPAGGQVSCSISPTLADLEPGDSVAFTVTFSVLGTGHFVVHAIIPAEGHPDTLGQAITVAGQSIQTNAAPFSGQAITTADSLIAIFSDPSGITGSSLELLVDGSVYATGSSDGESIRASATSVTGGSHTLVSYGCATNGRCDSVATSFIMAGAPVTYDPDSLPPANGEGRFGLLPGALPLPPDSLRGCPTTSTYPDILLESPFTNIYQDVGDGSDTGYIYLPSVVWDNQIVITSITADNLSNPSRTCATIQYLDQTSYDWNFWFHTDPDDPMRATYPYDDGPLVGPGGWSSGGGGDMAMHGGTHSGGSGGTHRPPTTVTSLRQGPGQFLLAALGIEDTSYVVTLNGDTIIKHGHPVTSGMDSLGLYNYGGTYKLSVTNAIVNQYDPAAPDDTTKTRNGGWNELIASIADTLGHRSAVRARFVVVASGAPAPVGLTVLRDFQRNAEGDCAAFGAFQCGGVSLAQALPGFTSRDRARALHLVYRSASAGAPLLMPAQLYVDRLVMAPDSLALWTVRNGVADSDTTRYDGVAPVSDQPLDDYANETRSAAAVIPPATSGDSLLETVNVVARARFNTSDGYESLDTSVALEVVRPLWTDTTRTRLGLGWNLAELGRLSMVTLAGGAHRAIYQTGDGSFVVFHDSASRWVAPPGVTSRLADTSGMTGADSVIRQILYLNTGASIGFNAAGEQLWTEDLVGNKTTYSYGGTGVHRLSYIKDPTGYRFSFNYLSSGTNRGRLQKVSVYIPSTAQTVRLDTLLYDGSGR
ncbi:MAG TPA: hypothetical protein VMH39_12870, partial [Gemmatimonadaceae bacterium]|nr:hypothetical protein [Gemmatimonadaceae bacterium]